MYYQKIKYKIRKFFYDVRAKIILKLIGDMPVIVNCTIYDDIFEYNFGKSVAYRPCIAFNNTVKSFKKYANNYRSNATVLNDF